MSSKYEVQKMRKNNMKIFPIYKKIGWDYLFFYTIDFLFLTQVKNISAADVVLKGTFYSIFSIILQVPASIIVEFLGRKNSLILGNVLNCFYMVIIMLSRNLGDLIFAEFISAISYAIKNVAEPSLLNESIPPSKYKSNIYSKINSKGTSGYYLINALSKIIAGYLFTINGYLPIICSFSVLIIVSILSIWFIEPIKKHKRNINEVLGKKELKDLQKGFSYVLKSNRLKAILLCASLISPLLIILNTYHVSLLQDLKISAVTIGITAALGSYISAHASKRQEQIHNKLKNKTMMTIALMLSISTLIAGISGLKAGENTVLLIVVFIANMIYNFCQGIYETIIYKYLRNFSNKDIDTKIFAAKNVFSNFGRVLGGFFAAFLLDKMKTTYCMIIIGIIFTILYILMGKYMKTRIGLKPEEYSKEETKYDEQKI